MGKLLASHGFAVAEDRDLLTIAGDLGLQVKNQRSLGNGRIAVADR